MQGDTRIDEIGVILGVAGKLLYTYPKYEDYKALADDGLFTDVPAIIGDENCDNGRRILIKWGERQFNHELFDEISADYIRLFVGGGGAVQAPPWESVYTNPDAQLFQESTLDIRRRYRKYGMAVEKLHSEPDDHVGLELLFISHLIASLPDSKDARAQKNDIKEFAQQHLANWAPHFCDIVVEFAKTDLFKGLAFLVKGGILELCLRLNITAETKVYR